MELNQDFYEKVMNHVNNPKRFSGGNGIIVTELGEGYAKGKMLEAEGVLNTSGFVHGGALSTMADTLCGIAVGSLGKKRVTVHNTMEYLKVAQGELYGESRVRKKGNTIVVCEVRIWDAKEQEVAIGTFTFYVLRELNEADFLQ